jgi:hypothetical protein
MCLALTVTCARANSILDPSFENPVIAGLFSVLGSGSTFGPWNVTGATCGTNCVLILNTAYSENTNVGPIQFNAEDGNQAVDITGGGNTLDGGVSQTIATTTGNPFSMSFWVGKQDNRANGYGGPSAIQVFINGVSQGVFSNNNSTNNQVNWEQFVLNFNAPSSSTTILFQNATGATNGYAGLDNVNLVSLASPEPSTLVLIAGAVGLLALRRRRVRA